MDTSKVTRFEVIDHRTNAVHPGRVLVCTKVRTELSLQDYGQTLKVFLVDPKCPDCDGKGGTGGRCKCPNRHWSNPCATCGGTSQL